MRSEVWVSVFFQSSKDISIGKCQCNKEEGYWNSSCTSAEISLTTKSHLGWQVDRLDHSSISLFNMYIIKSSLSSSPVDSSESSGESVSGFSSSSHSYHSALGGEAEDTSSVCVSIITVREAHRTETSAAIQKANALAGSSEKTRPPVAPKPKPQKQTKDLPCDKVQYKAFNQ